MTSSAEETKDEMSTEKDSRPRSYEKKSPGLRLVLALSTRMVPEFPKMQRETMKRIRERRREQGLLAWKDLKQSSHSTIHERN
jgi:hypothetical protein